MVWSHQPVWFHPGKSSPFFTTSWEMFFFASGLFKSKIQVQDGRLTQQLRPGPFAVFPELTSSCSEFLGSFRSIFGSPKLGCPWKLVTMDSKLGYNLFRGLTTDLYWGYNLVSKYHGHPSTVFLKTTGSGVSFGGKWMVRFTPKNIALGTDKNLRMWGLENSHTYLTNG